MDRAVRRLAAAAALLQGWSLVLPNLDAVWVLRTRRDPVPEGMASILMPIAELFGPPMNVPVFTFFDHSLTLVVWCLLVISATLIVQRGARPSPLVSFGVLSPLLSPALHAFAFNLAAFGVFDDWSSEALESFYRLRIVGVVVGLVALSVSMLPAFENRGAVQAGTLRRVSIAAALFGVALLVMWVNYLAGGDSLASRAAMALLFALTLGCGVACLAIMSSVRPRNAPVSATWMLAAVGLAIAGWFQGVLRWTGLHLADENDLFLDSAAWLVAHLQVPATTLGAILCCVASFRSPSTSASGE
jgi:hypothetical protein